MYKGYPSTDVYPSTNIYPLIFELLIYDRTLADVEYRNELKAKMLDNTATAEEIEIWIASALKGAYNASDLNRVGMALQSIKNIGVSKGFVIEYPYAIKTNYDKQSLPTSTDIAQLLENVLTLKQVFRAWVSTDVPTAIKTIYDANNIEYILRQIEDIFIGTDMAMRYSNELYSGGDY